MPDPSTVSVADTVAAASAARDLLARFNADTGQPRSVRYAAGAAAEALQRFIEEDILDLRRQVERDCEGSGVFFEEDDAPTVADLRRVFPRATEPVPLAELERREAAAAR